MQLVIETLQQRPEFLELIAQWHHAEWQHLNPGKTLQHRIARYQSWLNENDIPQIFVAHDGSTVSGSASLVVSDMDTRLQYTPWLAGVYVNPADRKQGIATQLIQRVTNAALSLNHPCCYLFTENQQSFYSKRGWKVIEQTIYRGEPVTVMRYDL